jgi:hypothetical protein
MSGMTGLKRKERKPKSPLPPFSKGELYKKMNQ